MLAIHATGGIVGAVLTGVFSAPALGGMGAADYPMLPQLGVQALGVVVTLAWSALAALLAFVVAKLVFGLRVPHDAEREGLDISSHGESAHEL